MEYLILKDIKEEENLVIKKGLSYSFYGINKPNMLSIINNQLFSVYIHYTPFVFNQNELGNLYILFTSNINIHPISFTTVSNTNFYRLS